MHYALAAVLAFGILTMWVPAYWPVAVFGVGVFAMATGSLVRWARNPQDLGYPVAPLSFAVLWGFLQLLTGHTASSFETRMATARWAMLLAVFITASVAFREPRVQRWFRNAMRWTAFVIAALATMQTFTSGGRVFWQFPTGYSDRVMGPILYPNHFAVFIEVALPLAIFAALCEQRHHLLYSAMAATMFASVLASASRAGFVLAAGEFVLASGLVWGRRRADGSAILRRLAHVALMLAAAALVIGWGPVWKRLHYADPFTARRELTTSSLHMIEDHPVFGTGMGTWPMTYPAYAVIDTGSFVNRAHDDWLEWTAEGGLPLGIAMLTVFLWCLRPALRSIWGIGTIAVFLHACVDYPFSRPALGGWIVAMIALMAATKRTTPEHEALGLRDAPEAFEASRGESRSPLGGSN